MRERINIHGFNPWHHVLPGTQETLPEVVNGIIEIPRGTRAKYELDKESGLLKMDRVLYTSVYYPANYGFIPRTYGEDKDPLDILILSQEAVVPMCIVPARIIGVMRMLDGGEADDKIIAVAKGDPSVSHFDDISDLPAYLASEIMSFFEDYKKLENKTVVVEKMFDKKTAIQILQEALAMYNAKYGTLTYERRKQD
ncbi:inorganic pyrophosphatase [Parelusimicrobium proximum]|uniref:inorganic diphosphatase n=1 Tax=Parelusimicrobium proximum TaxID=3228953 RepID=UPI003D1850DC